MKIRKDLNLNDGTNNHEDFRLERLILPTKEYKVIVLQVGIKRV